MPSATDPVVIPAASTTSIHYGLLRMAHCLVVELPESKLQNVRHSLNVLLGKVDQILDSAEHNFSLNFNGLTIDPTFMDTRNYLGDDFGAIMVSTTVTTESSGSVSASSPSILSGTVNRVPVPSQVSSPTLAGLAPAPTPTHTPVPVVPTHGPFPYIVSRRANVSIPNYTHHPHFIRPGVPGYYEHPPSELGLAQPDLYYIVIKGLYVGVFDDWLEVSPWVSGVSNSAHRSAKTWEQAKSIYNAHLRAGTIQVLP